MIRLIFWCLIGWLLYVGLRRLQGGASAPPPRQPGPGAPEDMVRCRVCGLNVPKSEAFPSGEGSWACCAEHARQADAAPRP